MVNIELFPFSIISTVLFCCFLACIWNVGKLFRYLFCVCTGIGTGPVILPPFSISGSKIRMFMGMEGFTDYTASYKVLSAFLAHPNQGTTLLYFRISIIVQLAVKVVLCIGIVLLGILHRDQLLATSGFLFLILILDFSCFQRSSIAGEYVAFRELKYDDSKFAKQFWTAVEIAYIPEHPVLLCNFIDSTWNQIKVVASPEYLSAYLYYVFLYLLGHPEPTFTSFYEDVYQFVRKWLRGIDAASHQWWFVNLYILWAHRNQHEKIAEIEDAIQCEIHNTNIPLKKVNELQISMLQSLLALTKTDSTTQYMKEPSKYKILYRGHYCKSISGYVRLYKNARVYYGE